MKLLKKKPLLKKVAPPKFKQGHNPLKKRPAPREEEDDDSLDDESDDEDSEGSESADDFLAQGADQLKRMRKEQEAINQAGRRAPEVFITEDGKSVRLRFLSSEPSAIFRYTLNLGNGPRGRKRFGAFTKPAKGQVDLFARAGNKATLRYIYPVIDLDGYVDKETRKRMKNLPRYLLIPTKVQAQLETIRAKRGSLTKMDIEMTRSGTGTQTTYSFYAEAPSDPPKGFKEAREKLVKEMREYYKPPTEEAQRTILGSVTVEDDED